MATLATLRQQAKSMGIAATVIRSAENAAELQSIIDDHTPNGAKSTKASKKAVKKAVAKKKGAVKKSVAKKSSTKKAAPTTKRNSKSASSKKSPAAKTAKRASTAKASTAKGGRYTLEDVDYNVTDGWNARNGSAPDRIVKALRKYRGNRSKVFDFLVGDVWDFAGKRKRDGSKRTKAEAEKMLAYRIARTDWDFALATGQHEKSDNRVEYGTGGTGQGIFKRAKKGKASAAKAPAKRGRPAKAAKAPAKRGRPKGSTNKKAAARKAGKAAAKKRK